MQRLIYGDVVALARVMLAAPPTCRRGICKTAFHEAKIADLHRARTGRLHPAFGDGSLAGWAGQRPKVPERPWDDPGFLGCLREIIGHVLASDPGPCDTGVKPETRV